MKRFDGKVAIVTGAKLENGQVGIGGAIARLLVRDGARVVLANRTLETAQALAAELDAAAGTSCALAVQMDLRDEAQIESMVAAAVDRFGGVDLLFNNAAVTGRSGLDGPVLELDTDTWDSNYTLNVRAPFLVIRSVLPSMLARGGGAIVNTSSTASLGGEMMRTSYASSKAALNMLTQSVATQYGRRGVRCNAVLPGLTITGLTRKNLPRATREIFDRHILRPQHNDAEDVARVAVFLAAPEGAAINGALVRADAGITAHLPYAMDFADLMQ